MIDHNRYLDLVVAWLPYARKSLYRPRDRKELLCYGTGYDSWGVQTNQKAFSAFAVCGALRDDERAIEEALGMLRFCLQTHIEGSFECTDERKWGHTWISALGTERMMHAVRAVEERLSEADRSLLGRVLVSESDWLLDHYEIVAGLENSSGRNKPESNLWNGALLFRTAVLYPDATRVAEYLDKAFRFFVNGVSVPADASAGLRYDGREVASVLTGANYFPSFALNHHGYLNVGYMVICLSQMAMLHLWCRELGVRGPEALYHHAAELWRLVKTLTFPDGRLMRIGGDTRARYCYCQDYLVPTWLFALDHLGDAEAEPMERGWIEQLEREQRHNGDGGFISDRGRELRDISHLYYTRLDSDRACSISMGAWWRAKLDIQASPRPAAGLSLARLPAWTDEFHGSFFCESPSATCAFTWAGAEGPTALFLPPDASDMAEWRHNLTVHVRGQGATQSSRIVAKDARLFDGGGIASGRYEIQECGYITEGEADDKVVVRANVFFALLPDSRTAVLIQHAVSPLRVMIEELRGLFLQIPNDIWNGNARTYSWEGGSRTVEGFGSTRGGIEVRSDWMEVDGRIRVDRIYGPETFTIHRPGRRQIGFKQYKGRSYPHRQGMLYCDEVCGEYLDARRFLDRGERVVDCAYVLRCPGGSGGGAVKKARARTGDDARAVVVNGSDQRRYLLVLPLGDDAWMEVSMEGVRKARCRDLVSGDTYDAAEGRVSIPNAGAGRILEVTTA